MFQINISSNGGLPKIPIDSVFVAKKGLQGDYNKYRMTELNGDPTSAVLLLPNETIQEYVSMGYREIGPGSMGENFTLEGIHYDELSIGRRIALGKKGVIVKIERVCEPCNELLVYGKSFPKVAFGKRGMYASVEKVGFVEKGDAVQFLDSS